MGSVCLDLKTFLRKNLAFYACFRAFRLLGPKLCSIWHNATKTVCQPLSFQYAGKAEIEIAQQIVVVMVTGCNHCGWLYRRAKFLTLE